LTCFAFFVFFQQYYITKDKANREKYDFASKVSGAYADTMLDWKEKNPDATEADFYAEQVAYRNSLSESEREFVKEDYQTLPQISAAKERADDIQERLHPTEDKAYKPDYMVGVVKTKGSDQVSYGRTVNGVAQVQVADGKFRNIDPKTEVFLRGDATVSKDQLSGLTDDKPDLKMFPEDQKVLETSDEMAKVARSAMPRIDMSIGMYRAGLIEGGAMTEFMADFRNYAKSITGIDIPGGDDVNSVFTATATAKDAQLDKTRVLKGAISNREVILTGQATGIGIDNPAQASLLNLKIIKMAHLRETEYNDGMRAYIATQRADNKKPALNTYAADFAKRVEKMPGIVQKMEVVDGRKNIQFLFHWEQREKEINAAIERMGVVGADRDVVADLIGKKFDAQWMKQYGK